MALAFTCSNPIHLPMMRSPKNACSSPFRGEAFSTVPPPKLIPKRQDPPTLIIPRTKEFDARMSVLPNKNEAEASQLGPVLHSPLPSADLRRGRTDRYSSPWSTPPQSPFRKLLLGVPRAPHKTSAKARNWEVRTEEQVDQTACRSTSHPRVVLRFCVPS